MLDTYNSVIRVIDLKNLYVSTLIRKINENSICTPKNKNCNILPLNEPNDVEFFGNKLYVTDTNNHLIRIFDINTNNLS